MLYLRKCEPVCYFLWPLSLSCFLSMPEYNRPLFRLFTNTRKSLAQEFSIERVYRMYILFYSVLMHALSLIFNIFKYLFGKSRCHCSYFYYVLSVYIVLLFHCIFIVRLNLEILINLLFWLFNAGWNNLINELDELI